MKRLNFTLQNKVQDKNYMEIINKGEVVKLYIYGDICNTESDSLEDISPKNINDFLKEIESFENLEIYINSYGGSVYGGLAIYNMLNRLKCPKKVYIDSIAGSIASVIAMVGNEILMPKNAQMMIHKPLLGLCGFYNEIDFKKMIDGLKSAEKSIISVYKERLKDEITEEELKAMLEKETFLTAKECTKIFKNVKVIENEKDDILNILDDLKQQINIL